MIHSEDLIQPFMPASEPPPQTLVRFSMWSLQGCFLVLSISATLAAIAGIVEVSTAWMLGKIVDEAIARGPDALFSAPNMITLAAAAAFFLLARPLLFGLASFAMERILEPNLYVLTLFRLHHWTLGQSVRFFDNDFAGRLSQKLLQTAGAMTHIIHEATNTIVFAFASVAGAIALALSIDSRLGVAIAVWVSVYLLVIRWFLPRLRKRAGQKAGARAMLSGQIVDTITNIKLVKLFSHHGEENKAARTAFSAYREKAISFASLIVFFRIALTIMAGMLPVVLVGGTLHFWSQGSATVGEVVIAGAVALRLAEMTNWVSLALMQINGSIGVVENGMETLTQNTQKTDITNAKLLEVPKGAIRFRDVSFSYQTGKTTIDRIDLEIRPREKVGIVGASGAGKTTLAALLSRLYEPDCGTIEIDGQNIADVAQESLRMNISMVMQDVAMFNRSAFDNISYGQADVTEDQVFDAARKAEAHDFIRELQDPEGATGYAARLGERGVNLSGGQRQRIALARAILKDTNILILDEATSALDSEVEDQIQTALENCMDGRTVLAIAHRLSTIKKMDRIIVMDEGRIVEIGNHDQLLSQNGLYANYWARQSQVERIL